MNENTPTSETTPGETLIPVTSGEPTTNLRLLVPWADGQSPAHILAEALRRCDDIRHVVIVADLGWKTNARDSYMVMYSAMPIHTVVGLMSVASTLVPSQLMAEPIQPVPV